MEVTAGATQAATLVDRWVHRGLAHAVIAPGSRSTPISLALWQHPSVTCHVHLDERSAAFTALGIGSASGTAAAVVTTSGTAAVELHPAVVEADLAAVPLLALTADRPPELRGTGAPQTIDQRALYGVASRGYLDVPVAERSEPDDWPAMAELAWERAHGSSPGAVQVNLAFTEPLIGAPGPLPQPVSAAPPSRSERSPEGDERDGALDLVAAELAGDGVIVAGRGAGAPDAVVELGRRVGWPVLADPLSGCRPAAQGVVCHADAIARSGRADLVPDTVLWLGARPASRAVGEWLAPVPRQLAVAPIAPPDPDTRVRTSALGRAEDLLDGVRPDGAARRRDADADWVRRWADADRVVAAVVRGSLDAEPGSEPALCRAVVEACTAGDTLFVSSSMPIRDVEWYGGRGGGGQVLANRGANGIDGVVSTAVGVALTGARTVALLGDLAFLHDTNGLLGLSARAVELTLVVVHNDGGGIFSMLPQASALDADSFEALYTTPHGLDLVAVAEAHGVAAMQVEAERLTEAVATASGVSVLVVECDRDEAHRVRRTIHDDVAQALARRQGELSRD